MRDLMTLSYVWYPERYYEVRRIIELAGYDPIILDELIELYLERERTYFEYYSSKR